MTVVIDLITRLPIEIGFDENPRASDTSREKDLLALVKPQTLLLLEARVLSLSILASIERTRREFNYPTQKTSDDTSRGRVDQQL